MGWGVANRSGYQEVVMFNGNQGAQPNSLVPMNQPTAGDKFVQDSMAVIQIATAVVTAVALGVALYKSFNQPDPNRNRFEGYKG